MIGFNLKGLHPTFLNVALARDKSIAFGIRELGELFVFFYS